MIDVRVQLVFSCRNIYWTGPIRNRAALEQLTRELAERKRPPKVSVYDDQEHVVIADACLELGCQEGTLSRLTWGRGGRYVVALAPLPRAATRPLPVVGGFPLLDAPSAEDLEPAADGSLIDVLDRELASAGTPPRSRSQGQEPAVTFRPVRPATWIDRLLAWLFVAFPQETERTS